MGRGMAGIAVLLGALACAPGAHAAGFLAGAAKVDTTPPATPTDFALCPPAAFTGPRQFAFEEPYIDLNANGRFDYPEVWCDANTNLRYDGIYDSGGIDHLARGVHDPIDARAVALTSGAKTVVVVSVVAQGIHETYTHRMRARARQLRPGISDVIVSSNHNESSPDTVGIYGGPDVGGLVGGRSGIDDYYMDFLIERVAQAAAKAYDNRRPASLWAKQFPLPPNLRVRLSNNFPTTDDANKPAAVDPKVGVLQARTPAGKPIFTTMSLAAHNQEVGHSDGDAGYRLSSDWPGYFHSALEHSLGGMAMFLVGDNGSLEDPETVPPLASSGDPFPQARATGEALAAAMARQAPHATKLRPGALAIDRHEFFVPLENNLFKAAAATGLFGDRQTYIGGVPAGTAGGELRTEVALVGVGPDLQLLANPGEAFPALMLGSPWGIEDAGCPERPNPPVPTWRAHARFRLQVGLADDMLGYQIPAWAYSTTPGVITTTCVNDGDDRDPRGHQHKLETEGVGPRASNAIATQLAALVAKRPDPVAEVRRGRFVTSDGKLTRRGADAAAVLLDDGSRLAPPGASFMDYDGIAQARPDITTRGVLMRNCGGAVIRRVYLDVYPALALKGPGRPVAAASCPGAAKTTTSCLARRAKLRRSRLGRLRIGERRARMAKLEPSRAKQRVLRFCVRGGGRVRVGFSRAGKARLVVTTARGHTVRRVHAGSRSRTFLRRFKHGRRLHGRLFGTGGRGFARLRGGGVRLLGIGDRGLVRHPRLLARYLHLIGL